MQPQSHGNTVWRMVKYLEIAECLGLSSLTRQTLSGSFSLQPSVSVCVNVRALVCSINAEETGTLLTKGHMCTLKHTTTLTCLSLSLTRHSLFPNSPLIPLLLGNYHLGYALRMRLYPCQPSHLVTMETQQRAMELSGYRGTSDCWALVASERGDMYTCEPVMHVCLSFTFTVVTNTL